MEIQRHRLESRGTFALLTITHPTTTSPCSPQLANKDTNATVAQSHSRIRSSIFKKPRDMGLEISRVVSDAADVVLLTFIIVWKERQSQRAKLSSGDMLHGY